MIHIKTPFRLDKNLALAYNQAFVNEADEDWICLIDRDVLFLTPNSIPIMYEYIKLYPDTGLFTCFTNRVHELSSDQLLFGYPSLNDSMEEWEAIAMDQEQKPNSVKEINHVISGYLMLVSKKTWNEIKFTGTGCLGIDNMFSQQILSAGKKILRIDRLVVWHSYRLKNIRDKSHLL
jgi:hypothetical protein